MRHHLLLLLLFTPLVWSSDDFDIAPPEFDIPAPQDESSVLSPPEFDPSFQIPQALPESQYPDDYPGGGESAGPAACWITSYGRGVGTIPSCASNLQYDAGLCYTPCPPDYKSVGPICWPNELSYGRGVGTIPNSCGDKQMDAGLCYNRCPDGFNPIGPVCWRGIEGRGRGVGTIPNRCPSDRDYQDGLCYTRCKGGFHGVGPVCWTDKQQVARGVGTIPNSCGGNDMDAGLCYQKCKSGFKGIGPVCWQDTCPSTFPTKCGALCVASEESCKQTIQSLVGKGLTAVMSDPFSAMLKSVDMISSLFQWPQCS